MELKNYPNIWITIDKIKHTLGWSDADFLEHLQMTEKQFQREKQMNLSPSLESVAHLTEPLGISLEAIVTGNIDYRVLTEHANGNLTELPTRYSSAQFSKMRTSIHILDYVEKNLGWRAKKSILQQFQINEAILSNPESLANFLMPSDICQFIGEKLKATPSQLLKIGAHSATVNKNSIVGRVLSTFQSPKVLFENIFTELVYQFYDKNQHYRILKLNNQYCFVEQNFREEVKDLLKVKKPGNIFACYSIAGSISSLTKYMDLPQSQVTKVDCVHRGGCSCKYLIDFSHAQKISKTIYQ